jgi:hypothetical protein
MEKDIKGLYMKRLINKANFAIIGLMAAMSPAVAADSVNDGVCQLVGKLTPLLQTLRTLAFIGAGFTIAAWAWDFIAKGEVKLEDAKKKGVGMLVGFFLLFAVGAILTFLLSAAGDPEKFGCDPDAFIPW